MLALGDGVGGKSDCGGHLATSSHGATVSDLATILLGAFPGGSLGSHFPPAPQSPGAGGQGGTWVWPPSPRRPLLLQCPQLGWDTHPKPLRTWR